VAEVQRGQLGVVQDAGDETACGSNRGVVVLLGSSVRSIERNIQHRHMRTMSSRCNVLFPRNASATATIPSAPMLLFS
jgi:hypothetical protein